MTNTASEIVSVKLRGDCTHKKSLTRSCWLPFHSCGDSALSNWGHSHTTAKSKRGGGRVITLAARLSLSRGRNNCALILSTTTQQGGGVHEDTFSASFLLSHRSERRILNHICSSLRTASTSDAAHQLSRMLHNSSLLWWLIDTLAWSAVVIQLNGNHPVTKQKCIHD